MPQIQILNGDHVPDLPFVIVDRHGMHVDLSEVRGELWDQATTARVEWGLKEVSGRIFGRVHLKNGQSRTFYDATLVQPYLAAYVTRWLEEKATHQANVGERRAKRTRELAKRGVDDGMARAAHAQVMQELGLG